MCVIDGIALLVKYLSKKSGIQIMNRRIPAQFQLTKPFLWQVMHLLGDFCLSWFKRSPWKTVLKLVVMQLMLSSKGQAAHTRKSLISIRLISQQFSAFYFIFVVELDFLHNFLPM
jgi:hypothetical protein